MHQASHGATWRAVTSTTGGPAPHAFGPAQAVLTYMTRDSQNCCMQPRDTDDPVAYMSGDALCQMPCSMQPVGLFVGSSYGYHEERGRDAIALDVVAHKLVQQPCSCAGLGAVDLSQLNPWGIWMSATTYSLGRMGWDGGPGLPRALQRAGRAPSVSPPTPCSSAPASLRASPLGPVKKRKGTIDALNIRARTIGGGGALPSMARQPHATFGLFDLHQCICGHKDHKGRDGRYIATPRVNGRPAQQTTMEQ